MSTTLMARPMDPEGKRQRREEVRQLAEAVRSCSAAGSWAEPEADLPLISLEYHVRGMQWHIASVLVEIFGEFDAPNVLATMLNGRLPEEHVEMVLGLLAECNRNLLAAELIELHALAAAARAELDAVITSPSEPGEQDVLHRAVGEIIAAEHAGELKEAGKLSQALLSEAGEHAAVVTVTLERARRDQKRLVELGVIEPPARNWIQRVVGAMRGTREQAAY